MNEEQRIAVEYNDGPLLIIAGPGTGKTYVIVEKIKYLIEKKLAQPEQILALTFTEKAASEMEERVDEALPYGYFQMSISTFHTFADQLLKEEAAQIGLSPGFKLMNEAETIIFLRQNLFLFNLQYFRPLGNPNKFLEDLLQHFSRLADEDISAEEYKKWAKSQNSIEKIEKEKYLELAYAYKTYQQLKIKEGLMDFSDLVFYLLRLFHQRPNVLHKYQNQFKYILVDEFQDTNIAQYELIKLLAPTKINPRLTVVGDDSQSIYKFRGASISNILHFMKDYPQAKQITLKNNYRSTQAILDAAYQLIKHNDPDTLEAKLGISKNLISCRKSSLSKPVFYLAKTIEEEADFVAKKILELKSKYQYSDFAVLVRANNHSDPFIRAFSRFGIPYQFLGPGQLFKQPEIKDLIAYLKVLYNLEDSPSLYRVLSMNIFSLDKKDLAFLLSFSKKISLSLFQAIEIYLSFFNQSIYQKEFAVYKKYLPLLRQETREILLKIYQMIKSHLSLIKKETAGQILYYFLETTGYLSKIISYKTEKEEKIGLNISKFFNKLKNYEATHEDASIFAVVDWLTMSMELGESPLSAEIDFSAYNAVNILTLHSAKGLEFPVVFLVNLSLGRFPPYEKKETIPIPQDLIKEVLPEGNYHLQEERRLFYVGLTRAKDYVFLSASKFYGETKRQRKISPFVFETLEEKEILKIKTADKDKKNQLFIFDFKPIEEKITQEKIIAKVFSFSQLEVFKTCPLQYKYQYLLKIPSLPSAQQSFGSTIHKTLQRFYQEFLTNPNINQQRLLEIYQENWLPIGYSSLAHQKRVKTEGKKMLINFFQKFHSPKIKILALEKLFKIKIDNKISITGKIDRIDKKNDDEIEIIDYKTGKKPKENEIKKSLQLSIYALAASDRGLFNKKLSEINLTFYYLNENEIFTMKKTEEEMNVIKEKIKKIVSQIQKNEFPPNPGPHCDFCSFKIICEAWQ